MEKMYGYFELSLILLVVSCPCALVMAAPIATMNSISSAAANGIIVKDACSLDSLPSVNCIGLDKTGTLTEGRCRVVHSVKIGSIQAQTVNTLMIAIEK